MVKTNHKGGGGSSTKSLTKVSDVSKLQIVGSALATPADLGLEGFAVSWVEVMNKGLERCMSSCSTTRRKLSERVNGQVKRLFKSDYHLLRVAGLSREQALKICIEKYVA